MARRARRNRWKWRICRGGRRGGRAGRATRHRHYPHSARHHRANSARGSSPEDSRTPAMRGVEPRSKVSMTAAARAWSMHRRLVGVTGLDQPGVIAEEAQRPASCAAASFSRKSRRNSRERTRTGRSPGGMRSSARPGSLSGAS